MTKVYLAGPITGLKFEGCTNWREYVTQKLNDFGIEGFSPMRGKKLNSNTKLKKFYNDPLKCPRGIYTRDKNDVKNCDLMIVNFLGSKTVSIGTCVEYGWADSFSKPVITIMEKEKNIHNHPFIQEISGFLVETLDEAIAIAKFILKP